MPSISVVKVDPQIPARVAALIGCGVTTGVGAAIKTAQVKPRGKLDLEGMVTNTYSIDHAVDAFRDMGRGLNARGVIVF